MGNILTGINLGAFEDVLSAVIILIIGAIVMKILLAVVRKTLQKSTVDVALHKFILSVVRIAGWIFIVVAVLSKLGVNTTTFVAVLSAAGAAVALALKDSLSNVAGGIIILITKPFGRGDYVQIAEAEGEIKDIGIMTTTIITVDKKTVTIPNGSVSTAVITNFSRQGIRRVDTTFQVSYDADLSKVKELLDQVAKECPTTLKDMENTVGVKSHDESGVSVALMTWSTPGDYWTTYFDLHERVKAAFDAAGIDIPYPHMDVRVHNA